MVFHKWFLYVRLSDSATSDILSSQGNKSLFHSHHFKNSIRNVISYTVTIHIKKIPFRPSLVFRISIYIHCRIVSKVPCIYSHIFPITDSIKNSTGKVFYPISFNFIFFFETTMNVELMMKIMMETVFQAWVYSCV